MYKLYGDINRWVILIMHNNEEVIISKMIATSNIYHTYHYLIIERLDDTDYIYKRIDGEEEFKEYLLDYKARKEQEPVIINKLTRKREQQ